MGEKHEDEAVANAGVPRKKQHTSDSALRRKDAAVKRSANKLQKPPTRKPTGVWDQITSFFIENQIKLSLSILGIIHSAHLVLPSSPSSPSITQKLIHLTHYNPETGLYQKGPGDLYLVFYWIVVFTLLRDAAMQYIFMPYAQHGGVKTYKGLVRFAEQAWMVVYYTIFWGLGMYITYNSPFWMNFNELWTDWPVVETTGLFKWYYLAQLAFWLQQVFVLHIEDRRKDHYQMFAHHIVTLLLITVSYSVHMMRAGTTILCIFDVVDILLPAAKLLRYLGYQKLCDVAFGVFLITWIISRHMVYPFVIKSVYSDIEKNFEFGCYSVTTRQIVRDGDHSPWYSHFLGSDPEHVCFTATLQKFFFALLCMLEVLALVWFYMISKVAYKVITGTGAEDTRSDDEDDGEEEQEDQIDVEEKRVVDSVGSGVGTAVVDATGPRRSAGPSGTSALSTLIMNGNGHSGSTHRHISSKLNGGDMH